MKSERIDSQYQDAKDLIHYLNDNGEVSYATYIDDVYKKILLLSAASFFEKTVIRILSDYCKKTSSNDERLLQLLENKVFTRQYHTLFNWDGKNTNAFWGLFGDELKKAIREKINSDADLIDAERAFLVLGKERNILVHNNLSEHTLNYTLDEIHNKYDKACVFMDFMQNSFIDD